MSFELAAQKLVYGGQALGHADGRPVLVPRTLPGERVEVDRVRTAKGVVHARPLRILTPAPERVEPPCPYFGRCGGCQYQHLGAENQISAKVSILRETLARIGKITWDGEISAHSAHPWNYRNQARFKVAHGPDGRVTLGFFEAGSHRLFPVDACLILSPRLNLVLAELCRPEWADGLQACREAELRSDDRDERVMLTLRGNFSNPESGALAREFFDRFPGLAGLAIERGKSYQVFGQPTLEYSVGEFRYRISPGSFFQASRFLLPQFVEAVASHNAAPVAAIQSSDAPSLAIDLFAGVGLFTLPLARHFAQVIAVEGHAGTAADLEANVRALGNVRAVAVSAFDFLRRFARLGPGLAVVDPPRAGVDAATLKVLTRCRPRRIYYVSCSPPTMARDLRYLVGQGYELSSIELFDLFPQTYHIESLAKLDART